MRKGEVSYYLYDGHGDVRALLNEAGRITDKYRYNAYGELLEKTGDTENHYLYTGEYYDGTSNLYYLRARYMNPSTGTFISMDTYEGSIYDPDTLHKYLYANGNPVTYSDPSGNMFDFSSTAMGMGIQNVLNNAVQISYRGLMCGLINMTLTAVMGGSWEQAKSSFVTGFILGAGISVVRYFAVGAELVTLARFYVLSASANFIFSATMTVFAVTKGYSNLAVTFGVMVILSIAEWCWAYGNYLLIDVYGNNGSATIECNPSGESEKYYNPDGSPIWPENRGFEGNPSTITLEPGTRVDRFGYDSGTFVSPEGTPYTNRSLPIGTDAKPYTVFEVVLPVEVQAGKIAPWFGEVGGGIQYEFSSSINELIEAGILRKVGN